MATDVVATRRAISADDLFRLRWLSEPRIAPDGERAAVTITALDRDRDKIVSQVGWLATSGHGELQSESPVAGRDRDPQWAPDSRRLAFVSDRSGRDQVWVVDTGMRSSRPLTESATGATGPAWSPDAQSIAFVASDSPTARPTGGYMVAPYRWKVDGVGVTGGPVYRHVWTAPVGGGAARQLTSGEWDDDLPRWSPDGSTIAFRSNRTADRLTTTTSELWLVGPDGGEPRLFVPAVGAIRIHAWSPDGRWVAYIGHRQGEAQGVNNDIWVVDAATGDARNLTGRRIARWASGSAPTRPGCSSRQTWPGPPTTAPVMRSMRMAARALSGRAGLDGSFGPVLAGPGGWFGVSVAATSGSIAALGSTPEDPGELVIAGRDGSGARAVTQIATEWRSGIQFGRLERFEFDAPDGTRLEAWIQHPSAYASDARLPVVLLVHGGPHWPLGARFGLEFRRLAEQGYRVLYLNPRGSMGYGNAYAQANVGDWGGIDARDLLAALDAACARPDVDPGRQAVTGESYGGFMTNWLIATTDRFAAAVTQSCISDFRSEYLTTDEPTGFDWDIGGSPWDQPERYEQLSPLSHVQQIRTPLLLIHSELDQNCPINQSEQLYTALQLLGREPEFLRLPGEGHLVNLVGRPSSRLARIEATDRFLKRHLDSAAGSTEGSTAEPGPG